MLTIETERRVSKVFTSLSLGELSCLLNRHSLITHRDFNGYQCFKRLDQKGKEYIDAYDIVDFLKSNNTYCTIDEAEMIVMFYDKCNKEHMSYSNFFTMLYSGMDIDPSLSFNQPPFQNTLSSSIEYLLFKVLSDELKVARETKQLIQTVNERYDFNAFDLYQAMEGRECITEHK